MGCRESANGRIKQWTSLANIVPNSQLLNLGDFVRMICALCNAFGPPSLRDSTNDAIIINNIQSCY